MTTTSGNQSFVKLPGPINLDEDSEDEKNTNSTQQRKSSLATNQTPKTRTPKTPHEIPEQSPKTEVMLSPMSFSPEKLSTPQRKSRMNDSLFTPNSPIPTPKQQEDRLKTSTMTFHDETKNYSTILKNKSPVVAKNTKEASFGETYRKLYYQRKSENQSLLHKKSQLEVYLRRSKLENQQLLARQRESNKKLQEASPRDIEKYEKRIQKAEEKLKTRKMQQELNPNFLEIVRINQKVQQTKESEKHVVDGLTILNSLMSYSLQKSDIDNILSTNSFEGEIGQKFCEFLRSLQAAIPKLEPASN